MYIIQKFQELKQIIKSLENDNNTNKECFTQLDEFEKLLIEYSNKKITDEQYFQFLTESIADVVWVLDLNDNKFVYVSPTVYRLRGYTAEEVMNNPMQDSLTEESAKKIEDILKKNIPKFLADPSNPEILYHAIDQPHKNGSIVNTETSTFCRINSENQHIEVVGVSRDISERKQYAQQILQRNNEIELLLKGSRLVLESKDFNTTAQEMFNYCKKLTGAQAGYIALLDHSEEENDVLFLDHGSFLCYVNPDLTMPIRGLRGEVYKTGETAYDNDYMSSPHLKYIPEGHLPLKNVMFAPLKINNATIGLLGLGQKDGDFTEKDAQFATSYAELVSIALKNSRNLELLKQREEELQKSNADKDKFFSILAHDLKNPFISLLGFSDLLLDNLYEYDMKEIENQITIINQVSHRTLRLLEDLLVWAKSQSGRLSFEPEPISLDKVCNELIKLARFQAKTKNISISYFEAKDIKVFADIDNFKTIMRNLISNAIKFTNQNGKISVYTRKDNNNAIISVSDNGVGIEEKNMSKIWEITKEFIEIGTAGERGTGLGLVLCKEFVEKNGGTIWVESQLGKGSIFSFTLPLYND